MQASSPGRPFFFDFKPIGRGPTAFMTRFSANPLIRLQVDYPWPMKKARVIQICSIERAVSTVTLYWNPRRLTGADGQNKASVFSTPKNIQPHGVIVKPVPDAAQPAVQSVETSTRQRLLPLRKMLISEC